MYEYPVTNATLEHLFDPNQPNSPALWAVLKGNYAGIAVVDDERNPSQCVLRTNAALTYLGHQTRQAFLDDAVARFRKLGPVWLVWPHNAPLRPPEYDNAAVINRLEFYTYDPDSKTLSDLRQQLPDEYVIRPITRLLLERCEWRDEMEYYAGSIENFLRQGIGFCMMREGEIIVEAYASALGKARAEIGAITRETYRGRGYAPIACAYLIEACEQRGYQAYWSCDADHTASVRVANKLGFQQERAYQIFEYSSLI